MTSNSLQEVKTGTLLKLLAMRRNNEDHARKALLRASRLRDQISTDVAEIEQEIKRREGFELTS